MCFTFLDKYIFLEQMEEIKKLRCLKGQKRQYGESLCTQKDTKIKRGRKKEEKKKAKENVFIDDKKLC